jgi:cbb3-type cytochrome oxidase subunit 3
MELIDALKIVGYTFGFLLSFVLVGLGLFYIAVKIYYYYVRKKHGYDPNMG